METVTVTVTNHETGEARVYANLSNFAEYSVRHALTGENCRVLRPENYSTTTNACLCTSFRWDTRTNVCTDCGHAAHGSRTYCGGLK